MTVYFAMLLHIYQPPVQIPSVIKKIANETYRPLIKSLKENPIGKITLNINAVLTELLDDFSLNDIIDGFALLGYNDQIEFTGSSKYHALLPLTPPAEIERQIKLNEETNRHYFGKVFNPKGFFPPEMAVSPEIFPEIKNSGHEWFAMSAVGNSSDIFPTTTFHQTKEGLGIAFRDDRISNSISFEGTGADKFLETLKYRNTDEDYYVIIAQDGETYGHHMKNSFEVFFNPLLRSLTKREDVKMVTISELMEKFQKGETIEPKVSSWSTDIGDINYGASLPLWYHPDNLLHRLQHKIIMKTSSMVITAQQWQNYSSTENKHNYHVARIFLDRGQHSCQQWWASKRPWYSPDMILRGLNELIISAVNARRSIPINDESKDIRRTFDDALDEILELQKELIMNLE
jgi:predicted glycosyl hydrolase (DUF1957 family)